MSARTLRLWRGDAEGGDFVDYEVEVVTGMVVLDAVLEVQQSQVQDLAVRWNCKAAKCGSCGAEVNGRPRLMCKTRFLVRIASLEMHPLDAIDRTDLVSDEGGPGLCNITKCCSEVCPEGIHITDNAIIPLKERVVERRYDPLLKLVRRIAARRRH